jgi:hypothetical protein
MTGLGSESRYQEEDVVVMYHAGEADIARITQPRKTAALESEKPSEPKSQPKARREKDWISLLAEEETYIGDVAAFYRLIDTSKMIQVVTGAGTRLNLGAVGWGAVIRQDKAFTMMWQHYLKATNNTMELRAVAKAPNFLPPNTVVWVSSDSQDVRKGILE